MLRKDEHQGIGSHHRLLLSAAADELGRRRILKSKTREEAHMNMLVCAKKS
jgi:hypothetical protein